MTGSLTRPANPGVRAVVLEFLHQGVLGNMLAMWVVQFFRKTLPLITMPYLGRVLGPSGWGLVAFFQSYAMFIALLVEYGFNLSATRSVARCRESREELADLFAGVLGAKVLLAGIGVACGLAAVAWIPMLREYPALLAAALVYAVFDGFQPHWYFMGLERMGLIAALEVSSKTVTTIAIFLLVRNPEDAWLVLVLSCIAPVALLAATLAMAYRQIPFRVPDFRMVGGVLRAGWGLFLFRSAESIYTMGNAFILGLLTNNVAVGYFAGAEKISRAVYGLFNPIREALYPRLSALMERSPAQAARLARMGMLAGVTGALLMAIAMFWAAPLLVAGLLGPQFGPAVPVLRVMSALPLLLALTQSVGLQWLLPQGRDSAVNRIMMMAGPLNVLLAVALAPSYQQMGMAWAVVTTEVVVCTCMLAAVASHPSYKLLLRGSGAPKS